MRGGANRADPVMVTPDDRPLAFWGRAAGNLGCNRMRWHPSLQSPSIHTRSRRRALSLKHLSPHTHTVVTSL